MKQFVTETLSIIQPELVLCGGDLTEAKSELMVADQEEAEWWEYRDIVDTRWEDVAWLDIRGNHDTLNVLSRSSHNNYYANYSVMGRQGFLNSYKVKLKSRNQKFNIIAIDATWELGLNYPFNFVGYIDDKEQESLERMVSDIAQDEITVMFGHYPTSVVRQYDYIRNLISRSLVYMSGHLHDLAFFKIFNMYSFHDDRDLELELVDWKNNRRFRVFAVDDGKLSFTDVKFNEWPIALITYPKDVQFMMSAKEDYSDYKENTIRVLVFHTLVIKRVTIGVDDEDEMEASHVEDGPLYILPWDSTKYDSGVHKITVRVVDEKDQVKVFTQDFTLNPNEAVMFSKAGPNFVLRSSFSLLFHTLFGLTLAFNIIIPVALKVLFYLAQTGKLSPNQRNILRKVCSFAIARKLMLIVSHNVIYFSLLAFMLYMALGPWVIGSLVDGNIGALFAWGALVSKKLVHSQVPFAYYFVHFGIIHPVMVFAIGHVLDYRHGQVTGTIQTTMCGHILHGVLLILMMSGSIFLSITFWLQHGVLGFFLGPLKTWSYVFYSVMFVLAWKTKTEIFTNYIRVISRESKEKKNDDEEEEIPGSDHELLS